VTGDASVRLPTFGPLLIGNLALFGACATCWIARSVLRAGAESLGVHSGLVFRRYF
jgi:hypothetical protein